MFSEKITQFLVKYSFFEFDEFKNVFWVWKSNNY